VDDIGGKDKGMGKAYQIAQELLKDRLKSVNPEAYEELKDVSEADVLVVPGQYDHIEDVLRLAGTRFTLVAPEQFDRVKLRPDQILFINCPGNLPTAGLRKLEAFVSTGGFLFTTDWALKHVLEPAFPGYLRYNQRATADEVVRVEVMNTEDPFLKSLIGPDDDPQWWLESSSYPIEITDGKKVNVLVSSKEIATKYGEAPVFVTFEYGEGKVYHMISHFYLQRSETRTKRQQASAEAYLNEKEIPDGLRAKYSGMGVADARLADVESAFTSSVMMNKVMLDKKLQMRRKKDDTKKG
jgi:hypothetical protein